mgnify:CR=1 FL=1
MNVVPLMAATNISVSMDKGYRMAYSNYLIEEVAKIINGNSYQMLAPQYVTSPEAKKVFHGREKYQRSIRSCKEC